VAQDRCNSSQLAGTKLFFFYKEPKEMKSNATCIEYVTVITAYDLKKFVCTIIKNLTK